MSTRVHARGGGLSSVAIFVESMSGLIGRLALAAALVFVGFIGAEIYGWLTHSHNPLASTPARGVAAVVPKTYTVATEIPCGSLALVDVQVHVSVATSAWFGLLGAHVNATYPEQVDVCVGGSLLAKATVSKSGVLVAVPALQPVSTGVDDLSSAGSGGVGTAWYQSATSGEINSVEKTSRQVADVSTALTPLPEKRQKSILLAAEKQALPGLTREFHTDAIAFRQVRVISPFDLLAANWRTFGPKIRTAFPTLHFGADGLTVTAKDGTGGVASIGQGLTSSQAAELNRMAA